MGGAVALTLIAPPQAAATVNVEMAGEHVIISQTTPERVRFRLEHFSEQGRANGIRVRQLNTGDPTIASDNINCAHNPLFNDVVCLPFPTSGRITTAGEFDDQIEIGGTAGLQICEARGAVRFEVELAGGNDILLAGSFDCPLGFGTLRPRFLPASGGPGNDSLHGGDFGDTLDGGPGADFIDGGPGVDTATYQGHQAGITITLDGVANDGVTGEGDNLLNIERVNGTPDGDRMTGQSLSNVFRGEGGPDELTGAGGNDHLVGGNGPDVLSGGSGGDVIEARDGVVDDISCLGGIDLVEVDINDRPPRTPPGSTSTLFCENVREAPVDDGPPGHIVQRSLVIRHDRSARLRLICPADARTACRGRLRLLGKGPRVLAQARYRVPLGRTRSVRLRLSERAAAQARRDRAVLAATRERGVSKKGPRGSYRQLRVR